jgi:NADH-quinone oxidoreductase subunit L
VNFANLFAVDVLRIMAISTTIVFAGIGLGYWIYGRRPAVSAEQPDPLERKWPDIFALLRRQYFVDEVYEWAIVGLNAWCARACDWLDRWIVNGGVQLVSYAVEGLSWVNRFFDEYVVNPGFDQGCRRLTRGGNLMSRLQDGRVQHYLRVIGIALTLLALALIWGCSAP